MSAGGTILRRCVTSVLLSWLVTATDVIFVVKSWMSWFKCRGGEEKFRNASETAELSRYRACIGEWGDWVIYYKFINWAIVATAVFLIGPLVEGLVFIVLSVQARRKRQAEHRGAVAAVAAAAGNSTATVLSAGLWAKTRELLLVRRYCRAPHAELDGADDWPVRHLFKLKIVEVLSKGIMIALAATVVLRDSSIAKHRRSGANAAVPSNSTVAAASSSGRWPIPGFSNAAGVSVDKLLPTAKRVQEFVARPVQSFRAVDERGGVAAPSWWALAEMAVALITAAHAAAGFIWYCSASTWSSASRKEHDHHKSCLCRCCAHLPFSFFHVFVFQALALYCTIVVYAYAALHLIARLTDGRLAFFLLLLRWGWQMLIMTLACMRHCSGGWTWLSCFWKSLVSSFTYMPWRIPGASKWGLTFWLDLFGTFLFTLAGNSYFVIVREEVGQTKTTFSIWVPLSGAALSFVVLLAAIFFQAICWRARS